MTQGFMDRLGRFVHHACAYCWLIIICLSAYFYATLSTPPVKFLGYRIGTDNTVSPGEYTMGVAIIKRNLSRRCESTVTMNIQTKSGAWFGYVYNLEASDLIMKMAEKVSPNEFFFPFKVPENLPLGDAVVFGKAKFKCADNPFHVFFPAELEVLMPIKVE